MATAAIAPPRPYKNFLTPTLHRRFSKAAGLALLLCYIEAVAIGRKSSFLQSWFPIGFVGIRTLLLFISALAIFVLRVAQLHVGSRTDESDWRIVRKQLLSNQPYQTVLWYAFSAWWFSEVYIWSASKDADLAWTAQGKAYERPRLNERPIFLRSSFLTLAFIQASFHIFYDYDRLSPTNSPQRLGVLLSPLVQLRSSTPQILQRAFLRSMSMGVLGPLAYTLLIRDTAWAWTHYFASWVVTFQNSPRPARIPPFHISLLFRTVTSNFLLVLLWEFSNQAFRIYVAQEPLKNGKPLTDGSKDPNGSLLTGLKAKKEIPKSFAFWELLHISQHFPQRRQTFFQEIDRKGGPTWTQILTACIDVIEGIDSRIAAFYKLQSAGSSAAQQQPQLQSLPRITEPPKDEVVFVSNPAPKSRREKLETNVGNFARSHGQSPQKDSPIGRKTIQLIEYGTRKLLTNEQREYLSTDGLLGTVNIYMLRFLRSSIGKFYRRTFSHRMCNIVLGSPLSQLNIIVDAVNSLTHLAVSSLKEDPFGRVQSDVPSIIRKFTSTVSGIETLKLSLPIHYSDVDFVEGPDARNVKEVDLILASLRSGLRELLREFGEYADNLGLSVEEMRLVRKTAAVGEDSNSS